jgi:hypothetical protein
MKVVPPTKYQNHIPSFTILPLAALVIKLVMQTSTTTSVPIKVTINFEKKQCQSIKTSKSISDLYALFRRVFKFDAQYFVQTHHLITNVMFPIKEIVFSIEPVRTHELVRASLFDTVN